MNQSGRDNNLTDKVHPTPYLKQQGFYEKHVGMHLVFV